MYSYCISVSGCIDSDIHPASNDLPDAAKPFGSHPERSLSPLQLVVAMCEMRVQHLCGAGTVCEMSVQHVRGAGKVCETTMQHLRGPFTVCEMTMQHLHSPFTVCKMTMQHLRSPFTVCGGTMQHLHTPFTVCETIMQALHSLFGVCDFGSHSWGASGKPFSAALPADKPVVFCPFLIADHKRAGPPREKIVTGGRVALWKTEYIRPDFKSLSKYLYVRF